MWNITGRGEIFLKKWNNIFSFFRIFRNFASSHPKNWFLKMIFRLKKIKELFVTFYQKVFNKLLKKRNYSFWRFYYLILFKLRTKCLLFCSNWKKYLNSLVIKATSIIHGYTRKLQLYLASFTKISWMQINNVCPHLFDEQLSPNEIYFPRLSKQLIIILWSKFTMASF